MRFHALLFPVLASVVSVIAIFADDAYHIDYHQALLGVPESRNTLFHQPQASSSASLLYTISNKAVLGAVNPKDGSLVWRHALAGEPIANGTNSRLAAAQGDGKVISSFGRHVSAWDALDGKLVWTEAFPSTSHILGLETVPSLGGQSKASVADVIALAGHQSATGSSTTIRRLAGDDGSLQWEYSDDRSVYIQIFGTRLTDAAAMFPC
jgi:ER membrane protein complex subunit 1